MTEKDYSLLRPFDLKAAKAGALLTSSATSQFDGDPVWKYVAGPDSVGLMIVEIIENGEFTDTSETGCFLMAPLCWVEGKPVYPGNVLEVELVSGDWCEATVVRYGGERIVAEGAEKEGINAPVSLCRWPRPKPVKRWINVYPNTGYDTKAAADQVAAIGRIACIEIELPPLKP